jgi:hypothetical protein
MRRRAFALLTFALSLALAAVAGAQSGGVIQGRQGNTLELSPSVSANQSQSAPQKPGGNVREIPVIPPSQKVLTLPQVSTDFLGLWGGQLLLTRHYGRIAPPPATQISLTFGQRGGQVVMATSVYADPSSQILQTKVDSSSEREVAFEVAGLTLSSDPPFRHIEKVSLTLAGPNQLKCVKHVDIYVSGFPDPLMEARYEGTLHPISKRESRMMAEQALREGAIPQRRIERGNPPPPP